MTDDAKRDGQGPEEAKSAEFSEQDLNEVTGGASAKIKGESTDDKHKDWVE